MASGKKVRKKRKKMRRWIKAKMASFPAFDIKVETRTATCTTQQPPLTTTFQP